MSSSAVSSHSPALMKLLPFLAAFSAMASFGVGASFAKALFPSVGVEGTVAYRVGISSILLLAVWRPWRFRISRRTLKLIALYGASVASMNLLFFMSLARLPLGLALAIEFVGPLTLALLHARRLVHFVWVGLAIVGLVLLLPFKGAASALDPVGVALAAAAGVFWALYILLGKRLGHAHPGQSVAIGMSVAALFLVPIGVAHAGLGLFSPALLPAAVAVGLLSSAIPYSLEMFAMRHIPERTFGVLTSAEPALGALSGLLLMHEQLTGPQWLAITAIVTAAGGAIATSGAAPAASSLPGE